MTTIGVIAKKFRGALRNETGTTFGPAELRAMVEIGVLDILAVKEIEELKAGWISAEPTPGANPTGSRPSQGERLTLEAIDAMVRNA